MIKGIKFASVPVKDQDRALEFYTTKLGFRIITDSPFNETQRWIELGLPRADTKLVLFTAPGQEQMIGGFMNVHSKVLDFPEYKYETNGMAVFLLPHGGWTALMYAARQNAVDAAAALADLKADLNAVDADGTSALEVAIINLHYDLATLLLNKGANPNVPDTTGMTALYAAVDMRAPANMMTRPDPKLRDEIDAAGMVKVLLSH